MRQAVVVLGAIGTIEITAICHVKAALQRFAVDEALARFQNVIAGKFAADFVQKLHAMMKEHAPYDNLPAKQSPGRYPFRTPATFLERFNGRPTTRQRLATVRKSKQHFVPSGSSARADQPPRLLGFQRPHGRL